MTRRHTGPDSAEAFGTARLFAKQQLSPSGIVSAFASGLPIVASNRKFIFPNGVASLEVFGADKVLLKVSPSGIASGEAIGVDKLSIWTPAQLSLNGWWKTPRQSASFWPGSASLGNSGGGTNYALQQGTGALQPVSGSTLTGVDLTNTSTSRVGIKFQNASGEYMITNNARGSFIRDYNWDGHGATNEEWFTFALVKVISAPTTGGYGLYGAGGWGVSAYNDGTHNRFKLTNADVPSDILPTGFNLVCTQYHPYTKDGFAASRARVKVNSGSWLQSSVTNAGEIQTTTSNGLSLGQCPGLGFGTFDGEVMEFGVGPVCPADSQFDFLRRYMNWAYGLSL